MKSKQSDDTKPTKGTRDGLLQADVIALLVKTYPNVRTLRWRDETFDAFKDSEEVEHVRDDFRSCLNDMKLIPDAFAADSEAMRLDFFEVEITSPMSRTKMQTYAEFLTVLDYYGIAFSVFTINQHGHINEVELIHHYVNLMKDRHGIA